MIVKNGPHFDIPLVFCQLVLIAWVVEIPYIVLSYIACLRKSSYQIIMASVSAGSEQTRNI